MKQLLGMAREKKEKEVPKISVPQKKQPPPQFEPASQSDPEFQQYEMNEEELIGYAQFLGIRLPQEEDLLWIAEEGLCAELPTGWIAEETQENGQIMYINTKTGEQTYQHPCDQYYQQLVIQERKKKGGSKILGSKVTAAQSQSVAQKSFPSNNPKQIISQPKPTVTDPLVKMQQEKQLRKLQDQKKKEFEEKKTNILGKHEAKKQELQKELRQKQDKTNKKYQQDIKTQKEKDMKKMSQKQREIEQKLNKEVRNYESQAKMKAEKAIQEKRRKEREIIDNKMRQKKQEIKKDIQAQLKKAKKDIDNEFKQKLKIVEQKQKKTTNDTQQLDNMLQTQIKNLKNEIIRRKMKQHAQKLRQENERQKDLYNKEIQQMQATHDQKIAQIQTKEPKNKIKMEELIKECQREEEEELQAFRYQLEHFKNAKQFQNQEKIQQFRIQLQEEHKKAINQLIKEYDVIYQKYRNLKNQQYQSYIWEAERKSKQEYLRSLKALQKKFNTEQEIAIIQNSESSSNALEGEAISKMGAVLDNLNWEEKEQRRELQNIKLEIDNLRSQNLSIGGKLNENQMKLYQLIQDKIKSKPQHSQ